MEEPLQTTIKEPLQEHLRHFIKDRSESVKPLRLVSSPAVLFSSYLADELNKYSKKSNKSLLSADWVWIHWISDSIDSGVSSLAPEPVRKSGPRQEMLIPRFELLTPHCCRNICICIYTYIYIYIYTYIYICICIYAYT